MPKVPGSDYVSSQQVPESAPFVEASGTALAAPALAAEQGFKQLQAESMLAQRHVQYIEAERDRQNKAATVLGAVNDATGQIFQEENRLRFGYTDENGNKVPPAGSADYIPKLQERFKGISDSIIGSTNEPDVKTALDRGLKQLWESRLIHAQSFTTSLHVQEQESEDIVKANESAGLAAVAGDPIDRERIKNQYLNTLDVKYGTGRPKYVEALKKAFNTKVQTAYMQHKLESDPLGFAIAYDKGEFNDVPYDTRTHLLNQYNAKKHQEDARQKQLVADNRSLYDQKFYADLNDQKVSPAEMEQIKTGTHPYYTSKEYAHIKHLYDNPPDGRGNTEIGAIRDQYLGGIVNIPTVQYIQHYRQQAVNLSQKLGVQNKDITKFLEELKHDTVTATVGNIRAITEEMKKFEAGMKAERDGSIGIPIYDKMLKGKFDNADGMGRGLILQGGKADEALKAAREQYKNILQQNKNTPAGKLDSIKLPER